MPTYTCHCPRFYHRPEERRAKDAPAAALAYAQSTLPGPDPWAQVREEQYDVHVEAEDGTKTVHTVHCYQTTVWGLGALK